MKYSILFKPGTNQKRGYIIKYWYIYSTLALSVFIMVIFRDADKSREHKTWMRDKKMGMYTTGTEREKTALSSNGTWN